jgi:peptidoglycan L-alanyl-D-glutamate endopeptidase CwlK
VKLTLEYVRSKSAARLSGLLPVVKHAAETLIDRCYARGVPIVITQGFRTIAEQNALYAQGRTAYGNVVTNARGGHSFHNFGVAIDFALLLPNGREVSWDTKRNGDLDLLPDWDEVVTEAKRLGFAWGGDWRSFKDMPHFQMSFGLLTADYRAGRSPAKLLLDLAMAVITKLTEGDDTVALPKANVVVNGSKAKDGVVIDGLVYVPLREVSERLGATIAWDNVSKTASIITKEAK